MEKKSISDSVDEYTSSVLETPTTVQEFDSHSAIFPNYSNIEVEKSETILSNKSESELQVDRSTAHTDDQEENIGRNPFQFFVKSDLLFLTPAIFFNALCAVTDVASTIMVNRMFTRLTNFQTGKYSSPSEFVRDVQWSCFAIILIGLGTSTFGWFETFLFTYLGERQQVRCRKQLFRSLFSRYLGWFENNRNLDGDMIQLNRSIEEFRSSISEYLSVLCKCLFSIISLLTISMIYSWKLTLLIMSVFPLLGLSIMIFGKKVEKWSKVEDDETSKAISLLDWNFSSFLWIKIIFSQKLELNSFSKTLDDCESAFRKFSIYANIVSSIMKALSFMLFVQSFWFGSYLVRTKKDSSGDVISAFYSCLKLALTISSLSVLAVIYQKANTSFKNITKFSLSIESIEKFNETLFVPDENLYGDIRFKNISFGYCQNSINEGDHLSACKTLNSISLNIEPFKTTYIIGKSGSGKSTIANMLLKFYKPESGSISIDGHDLQTLDNSWLRDQITLVQQFPTVFNDTVENNILLGTPFDDLNLPGVSEAIEFFNFSAVVDILPKGFQTYLGNSKEEKDNLVQLSGGQEQKLNLVKAKLRDTNILILDESISALDIQQRELFMKKINTWRENRTTIIITHELSHVRANDMVYVIKDGRIVDSGFKDDLKNSNWDFTGSEIQSFTETMTSTQSNELDHTKDLFTILQNTNSLGSLEKSVGTASNEDTRPKNDAEKINSIRGPMFTAFKLILKKLAPKYKLWYLLGLLFVTINTILTPIFSYCFSHLINGIIPKAKGELISNHEQVKWSLIATGIAIANGLTFFISFTSLNYVSQRLTKNLQFSTLAKILTQDVTFFEHANPSQLSTLIMSDMRDFRRIFSSTLSKFVSGVAVSIVCIVWTLTIGWKYSLIGFSMFPLFAIFSILGTTIMRKSEFSYKDILNETESIVYESRAGIKTIMCYNIQSHFENKLEQGLNMVLSTGFKRAIAIGFSTNSVFFLVNVSQAIMFYYGFKLISTGEYTMVQMMQVIMMILMSVTFIAEILSSAPGLYRGLRVALKIDQLLFMEEDDTRFRGGYLTPNLESCQTPYCVSFRNVTFSYPSDPTHSVLNHLSMDIPRNQLVSIVGESGCGKSTIASLILRLQSLPKQQFSEFPSSQMITVDGYDINTIKMSWLMFNISVVTQKHYFFNGSIRENLLYGNPLRHSISDEQIWSIIDRLELTSMVDGLKNGLSSSLAVSGNILVSGGQAQRLSIARALLRPASVLLLDECTASLDLHSAEVVLDLLCELKEKGLSIICITHQEKVIRRSDTVIMIKNGMVAENGDFYTLLKEKGALYSMITGQNQLFD
ncbi:hypothetical protein PICMEDRAFT_70704 [Pichia membranifaciens NRRL Y-2026]|uniref:Uncharacterized protein n=1 Tax=Pichia membranifaciens NRRL Y-2026 TaxID=763406 RepID=A0A1E3NSK7_9ASCO|nr:hypothetical protein PICMEDRAFT_70704 [Pichia membranifaciens NRRL Y-2026]ODQ49137.1 hypothetical protein PICMEDRAFT_70704 [Pichia membranifaciens NRRL Y-2026]